MTKSIWTDREEDFLKLRRKEGHTFVEIGKALGRSATACRQYYAKFMTKKQEAENENVEFRVACEIVERHCRRMGGDVQVCFLKQGVEIARLSDAGSTVGRTLYSTLKEIEKYED